MLGKYGRISNIDVDSLETLAEINVDGCSVLWARFTVGVAVLSAFHVDFRLAGQDDYFNIADAAGDYTSPAGPILGASGDLTSAALGSHWIKLDVQGLHTVRLRAAGTSSTVAGTYSKG